MNRVFVDCFDCVFLAKYPSHAICPEGKVFSLHNSREVLHQAEYTDTEGKMIKTRIHQMIAEAFVANPRGKKHVGHLDGNKRNNHPSNLYWGHVCPAYRKLTEKKVKTIYTLFAEGLGNQEIARRFKVKPKTISSIRCGISWSRVYKEFYKNGSKPIKVWRKSRLTDDQIKEIYALFLAGKRNTDIAKDLNVSPATISAIKTGRLFPNLYHLYKEGSKART